MYKLIKVISENIYLNILRLKLSSTYKILVFNELNMIIYMRMCYFFHVIVHDFYYFLVSTNTSHKEAVLPTAKAFLFMFTLN